MLIKASFEKKREGVELQKAHEIISLMIGLHTVTESFGWGFLTSFNSILESQLIKKAKNKPPPIKKKGLVFLKEKKPTRRRVARSIVFSCCDFYCHPELAPSFSHPLMRGFSILPWRGVSHFGNEPLIKVGSGTPTAKVNCAHLGVSLLLLTPGI